MGVGAENLQYLSNGARQDQD